MRQRDNTKRGGTIESAMLRSALVATSVGALAFASVDMAQTADPSATTLEFQAPRAPSTLPGQSATVLSDGRWLLAGGSRSGVVSGAVIVVGSASASESAAASRTLATLTYPRSGHSATVLPDGTVAILGGLGADGAIASAVELIDPDNGQLEVQPATGLTPRTEHSATLLTDGEVLIIGGVGSDGQVLSTAELWDPRSGQVQRIGSLVSGPRFAHHASLLPNGGVLISGGRDAADQGLVGSEIYDPVTHAFSPVTAASDPRLPTYASSEAPRVEAVVPEARASNVPVDTRVAQRLSAPVQLGPSIGDQVSLVGPAGAVAGKVVAAESGRLLFFTPSTDLRPQATYSVFLQNAKDLAGQGFPFSSSSFTTIALRPQPHVIAAGESATSATASAAASGKAAPAAPAITPAVQAPAQQEPKKAELQPEDKPKDDDSGPEDWIPQEKNRHGDWRVLGLPGDPPLSSSSAATLSARPGQTAVAGRVLRYNGRPLPGVRVSVGSHSSVTDATGQFLLTGLSAGVSQLQIDGTPVETNGRHYTKHFMRIEVTSGKTSAIPNAIYLPRVDPASEVAISSPTTQELVLKHPAIPGLEVHIPKGVVIRSYDGKIVTTLSITPIPLDRPPYPTPTRFAVYFTLQPGGAYIDADAGKTIRVIYPNYQGLPAGTRADFWNYDPALGWQVYGQGTVSADGKQVIPDANVGFRQIISFGMGLGNVDQPPAKGPPVAGCVQGGDPVDCATGLFLHTATDLAVNDVIPISVTRTYRQNDPAIRAFGIGTNLSYNIALYTSSTGLPQEVDLVLADGSRVPYFLRSGTALSNAVWTQTGTPSVFNGSTLTSYNNSSGEGFTIALRDHTVLNFARHSPNSLQSVTDRNGNVLTITTQNAATGGPVTRVTSPSGRFIQFFYDAAGRITQATDNLSRSAFYQYDSAGRLSKATDPDNNTETYGYDSQNRLTTVTDKRGNVMVTNQYDANSRVSQQTLADGATWQFAYQMDGYGNVTQTTVTDPRGYVRQDTFNSSGYVTQEIRALGKPEQQTDVIQRDDDNLVLSITDTLGRLTQIAYDGFGNLSGITWLAGTPNAVTSSATYDPTFQQLTSYTDPLGHTTTLGLSSKGNVISIADALGETLQVADDARGRPISVTDPLSHVTQLTYDLGGLTGITDALGRTVSLFNDAAGRMIGISDPLGNTTQLSYDMMDRLLQVTDALGNVTAGNYDPNGNLLTLRDARGGTHTFTYDARNRVKTYQDPIGNTETYSYDGLGNVTSRVDRKGQTTGYSYDGLNRLTSVTFADSSVISMTWDAGNRPTQVSDTLNGTITRQYDGLDRMVQEMSPQGQVNYSYDAAGRRTQLAVSGFTPVTYQYDNANRLTQVAQGALAVAMAYDAASRRTSATLPNGVVGSYTFDNANELTAISYDQGATHVGDLAYSYDQAGRRVTQSGSLATLGIPTSVASATYDAGNHLTNWGGTALSYDNNGNLISNGSSGYSWNVRNQLTATSDGSGLFSYDALGRRVGASISGANTSYLYDGLNSTVVGSDFMLDGLALDEVYADVSSNATTSHLTDALGSTVSLTDGTGSITASYTYAPYGTTTQSGTSSTPFQYTGRENDGATNLYYYRARYYSPSLRRFVSEDPLALAAGANFYAYVRGNPISHRDPTGKDPFIGATVGAIAGGVFGGVGAYVQGGTPGDIAWAIFWGTVTGAGIGALDPSLGVATLAVIGGAAGGTGDVIGQLIAGGGTRCKPMKWGSTLGAVAGGAIGGLAGLYGDIGIAAGATEWQATAAATAITSLPGVILPIIGDQAFPAESRPCGCPR